MGLKAVVRNISPSFYSELQQKKLNQAIVKEGKFQLTNIHICSKKDMRNCLGSLWI